MTNYEYYRQTIDKITRMGRMVAVEEKTGKVTSCNQITCLQCRFDSCSAGNCDAAALAWANAECIEPVEPKVDWSIVPIDTKIYVKDCEKCEWEPRYFAKYENGIVYAWSCGTTSFSRQYEDDYGPWVYARLAEE